MSVNKYDAKTGEISPLSPAYNRLAIVDVDALPTENIQDAIYCVASDNYIKNTVVLSNTSMTHNTEALRLIGLEPETVGYLYTYTPKSGVSIRYLNNTKKYEVSSITIDSSDWSIGVYDMDNNPLMRAFIDNGMSIILYSATTWTEVSVTLSHTNMNENTANLTDIGFSVKKSYDIYTYVPSSARLKYDDQYVDQITITESTGVMVITSPEGTELYNHVIVDGDYDFLYASAVTYWIGSAPRQTFERLAKASDMDVEELSGSQVAKLIGLL